MFPIHHAIPTLTECREIAALKPEFKEIKKDGYVVFDYAINDSHTFDDPRSLEMRGIAFNPETGELVGLALTKFFNYGEKANQNVVLDGTEEILEKLDGSMTRLLHKNNSWVFGTRAGETDVSRLAHTWLDKQPNKQDYVDFIESCLENDSWPIFEFWSPENSVVLNYEKPFLKLIAIRHLNGMYFDYSKMKFLTELFNIPMCEIHRPTDGDFQKFLKETEEAKGIEGFVVRSKGDWVKIKTSEYCQLHKAVDGLKFDKDVCLMVLDGTIDDVIPLLPEPRKSQVIKLRDEISCVIIDMTIAAERAFSAMDYCHNNRKQFAAVATKSLYKNELFAQLDGKPVLPVIQKRFRTAAGGIHTWKEFYENWIV